MCQLVLDSEKSAILKFMLDQNARLTKINEQNQEMLKELVNTVSRDIREIKNMLSTTTTRTQHRTRESPVRRSRYYDEH